MVSEKILKMLTDGRRTTEARVTGILIAHLGAFGSGKLIKKSVIKYCIFFQFMYKNIKVSVTLTLTLKISNLED